MIQMFAAVDGTNVSTRGGCLVEGTEAASIVFRGRAKGKGGH